jgi:hypothetical protein
MTSSAARRLIGLGVAALLVIGTVAVGWSASSTVAQAWFDKPLYGSHLPVGMVEITAHAAAPGGVDELQLAVDDVVVAAQPIADRARLATAQFQWLPPLQKSYWLTVRGRSGQEWGTQAAVFVIIGEPAVETAPPTVEPSPTPGGPTSAPSASPSNTPTASARPTRTPHVTASPTPKPTPTRTPKPTASPTPPPCVPPPPDNGFESVASSGEVTLTWEYLESPSCPPSGFQVQITRDPDFGVIEIAKDRSASKSQWTTPPLLNCTTFYWRVVPRKSNGKLVPAERAAIWSFTSYCPG